MGSVLSCTEVATSWTSLCGVGTPLLYGSPCGPTLALIPIVLTPPLNSVPCPCEWSIRALAVLKSIVDIQANYTPGDSRRFIKALSFRGFFGCDKGTIDRPDLWVRAYELALPFGGANFQSIYLDLLKEALTIGVP